MAVGLRLAVLTCSLLLPHALSNVNPLSVLRRDFAALNVRATARHLMRPLTAAGRAECVALKKEISERVALGAFVVDAFGASAAEWSTDGETASRAGLLGERMRQGTVRAPELDRACFTKPLGAVVGPIETEYGWHLLLVEERLGCRADEGMTRVVAVPLGDGSAVRSALAPPSTADERASLVRISQAAAATAALWVAANMLGGTFAQVATESIARIGEVP